MLPPAMPKTMSMPASLSTRTMPSAARVSLVKSLPVMARCALRVCGLGAGVARGQLRSRCHARQALGGRTARRGGQTAGSGSAARRIPQFDPRPVRRQCGQRRADPRRDRRCRCGSAPRGQTAGTGWMSVCASSVPRPHSATHSPVGQNGLGGNVNRTHASRSGALPTARPRGHGAEARLKGRAAGTSTNGRFATASRMWKSGGVVGKLAAAGVGHVPSVAPTAQRS